MSTSTTHAPSANFETATSTATIAGRDRADAVDDGAAPPAGSLVAQPPPVPDHAGLAEREGDEHADRVQRDQRRDAAAEATSSTTATAARTTIRC